MLTAYTYHKCGTCRKATAFFRQHGIEVREIPVREQPPSLAELKAMLKACHGELRKLFNTSGTDYKALGLSKKLVAMSDQEALELLARNGNLVKRPFVIGNGIHLVGFNESDWRNALR